MIRKVFHLMRFHWGGIVTAFLCALLIGAPIIAFPEYAKDTYQGININHFGTDEDFYLARANEVVSGNGLGQPFLAEGKNLTDPTFHKIEQVVMLPYTSFGLESHITIVDWYNTLNIIGVFVLTLLLYALTFTLSKNRLLAVAMTSFVIGGNSIIFYKSLFYDNFNIYGRSIYPYAASIPFVAFLFFLYKASVEKRNWLIIIGAGASLGFLFYDYFYAWTFSLAILGSLSLISLIKKNWTSLKAIFAIGVIGVLIGSPLLISFLHFFTSNDGAQISYFLRANHTREPIMSAIGLATLALFFLYLWLVPKDKNNPFLIACILAGWIALEQQILSGRTIQYGHYYWYFIVPLSIIVAVYIVASLIPKKYVIYFASLLIVLALINTIGGQYLSFFASLPQKMQDQEYALALNNLNTMPYGVVLGGIESEPFPLLVTTYTSNDVYYTASGLIYHTSLERLRETLLVYLALNKEARQHPIAFIEQSLEATSISPYRELYQEIEGYASGFDYAVYLKKAKEKDPTVLEDRRKIFSTLEEEYQKKFSSPGALRSLLIQNGVRYVLSDTDFNPEWDLSPLAPMEKISESGSVTLYKLSPR